MSKLVYLVVLALLVAVPACSRDDPAPAPQPTAADPTGTPTVTPTPTVEPTAPPETPTPAPTPSATPTTVASRDGGSTDDEGEVDYYALDPGSTVGDLYGTLSSSEQTCIGKKYSAAELAELKERPVFDEQDIEGRQAALMECLEPETLSGVFYSFLVESASEEAGGLSAGQRSCLRELVDRSDVFLIAGAYTDPSPEAERALLAMGFGVLSCIPELAGSDPGPSQLDLDDSPIWSFAPGGPMVTGPVVVDGVVYVGSGDGSLYALDAESGELLWSFAAGGPITSIPAVVDGTVYVGAYGGSLYALDRATGEEMWRFYTGGSVRYAPAVGSGMVYFPAEGERGWTVHAVDAATGRLVWTGEHPFPTGHHIDAASRITPAVHGGRVYTQGGEDGTFYALDAATGEEAWQAEVGGYFEEAPAVLEGVVYLTVVDRAYAFDEATGELLWSVSVDTVELFPWRFPALVVDGIYYLAPGDYVHALDAATGEELWRYRAHELSTLPVVADGVLYGASELAEYLFALDAHTGRELWTLPTEDFRSYFLSVEDGVLYGELDEGYLFAVDAANGEALPWGFETGGFSHVLGYAVSDGVVYWAGPDGGVYAHAAPAAHGAGASPPSMPTPAPAATSPEEAERAIRSLPWAGDGTTADEEEIVIQLLNIASEHPQALWELLQKPWMRDGLSPTEAEAIFSLESIVRTDGESAGRVVGMPFLDTVEGDDVAVLQTLAALDREGLRWVLSQLGLIPGSADVLPATVALAQLEWESPERFAEVGDLSWVEDGIEPSEVRAVLGLRELALDTRELFDALVSAPWVKDGLHRDEMVVIDSLLGIAGLSHARRDEAAALRIAAMPFLQTVEGADAAAAWSLRALFWESYTEDYMARMLEHPTLRDGISDDEAIVVAALGVARERPELMDTLLDLGTGAVEKRVILLPLAGEATLSVLNVNPGDYSTLDMLERIVLAQEEFMGVPFPKTYIGLLVADATSAGGGGGPTGVLTVDPGYVEDAYIIAHELAHTYWGFSPPWIAEGAADFMTTVSAGKEFSSNDCSLGDTLSDLDRLYEELAESGQPTGIIKSSGCAYSLGRGLFLDLHETLGDEAFRRGFGRLYVAMRDEELDDECTGIERGVCYARAAFIADAAPDAAALAGPVIDRWYHGPRS